MISRAITDWFKVIRRDLLLNREPEFEADGGIDELPTYDIAWFIVRGHYRRSRPRMLDFIRKSGWILYHLSQICPLYGWEDVYFHPTKGVTQLRGPTIHITLNPRAGDTHDIYYKAVAAGLREIMWMSSTFGVFFLVHILNGNSSTEKEFRVVYSEIATAIIDVVDWAEKMEGEIGFQAPGAFVPALKESADYENYWCSRDWPEYRVDR